MFYHYQYQQNYRNTEQFHRLATQTSNIMDHNLILFVHFKQESPNQMLNGIKMMLMSVQYQMSGSKSERKARSVY